jgi:hypothetical protein
VCGQPLVWLVAERRASERLAHQLWRCTACERFRWYVAHPPWSEGVPVVVPFFEFLRQQQAEMSKDAYRV